MFPTFVSNRISNGMECVYSSSAIKPALIDVYGIRVFITIDLNPASGRNQNAEAGSA
jgi:hypothetical protein